jgi:tetratricopeptide (TPR) repeat protein
MDPGSSAAALMALYRMSFEAGPTSRWPATQPWGIALDAAYGRKWWQLFNGQLLAGFGAPAPGPFMVPYAPFVGLTSTGAMPTGHSSTPNALQFYRRAVATADPATRNSLLYEIASLTERNGDCVDALPYFRSFTERSSNADSVTEARWRMGSCGLERGRQLREAGDLARALELLSVTLDLGAPQNLLDQAWYERGEALMALGRRDEAAIAYERVVDLSIAGRTQLAGRAMRR